MALALALVAAGPPLVVHNGWPGLVVAFVATAYATYLLLGKRWPRRPAARRARPTAVAALARALGRLLAADGFEPDRYVFRRHNAAGDALIVDLQPLPPVTTGETRFAVHVGFLLAPYWEWEKRSLGLPPEKRPDMSHVNWTQSVTPADWSEDEWVITDEAEAPAVARRVYERLPDLALWLDRDLLWRAAAGGSTELGTVSESMRLWLLVERGQSDELREMLDDDETDRAIWEYADRQAD